MRSVLWLVLVTAIALALLGIAGTVSADPDVYEGVIVQDTYDVDPKDPVGGNLGGITPFLHPVPASGTVNLTFWIQSGDDDTDIDEIEIIAGSGVDLTDASGLSGVETGNPGDWSVSGNASEIVYTAVTDSGNDADDALDKGEVLTLVVTMDLDGDSQLFDVQFTLKNANTAGDENVTTKEYTYYFLALNEGDMYLQTWLSYASEKQKAYLLVEGSGTAFGENGGGTFQRNFADAYDVYRSTTDMVYIFFTNDADLVNGLTYTAVNPNPGSEIELKMNVAMFTAETVDTGSVVLSQIASPGLNTPAWIPNGGSFIFLYGPNLLGTGSGSHYIDDLDDDNDGVTDAQEAADGTDPRDATDFKAADPNGTPDSDDGEDDMNLILIASVVVIILGVVLGIMLVKSGVIGGAKPKKPKKVKEKKPKKKKEEEVKWEKPRERKKREKAEAKPKKKAAAAKTKKVEEEEEEEEVEAAEVVEEEEELEEEEEEEEEEVEEEEDDDDDFDFDDDIDFDELEAELADLEDEIDDMEDDDIGEDDLEVDLDDDDEDLEAELEEDDLSDEDLDDALDEDIDDLDLEDLESELEDL